MGLADRYADRGEDEEALCAVCAGGYSAAPNLIVFCERCDLAVHQRCYGVEELPAGEWLCWPCRRHEEAQRRAGVPQVTPIALSRVSSPVLANSAGLVADMRWSSAALLSPRFYPRCP